MSLKKGKFVCLKLLFSVELNKTSKPFGMSLKLEYHLNWNVTEIKMSLKLECHSNFKVTQFLMSLKSVYHLTQTQMMTTQKTQIVITRKPKLTNL